jgi:hypothetical protein
MTLKLVVTYSKRPRPRAPNEGCAQHKTSWMNHGCLKAKPDDAISNEGCIACPGGPQPQPWRYCGDGDWRTEVAIQYGAVTASMGENAVNSMVHSAAGMRGLSGGSI